MKKSLLLMIVLVFSGCASMDASGPQFSELRSPAEGAAVVYLMKPDSASTDGVTTCLTLRLDDRDYGCVQGKGYVVAEVDAGEYKAALVNKAGFGFRLLEFDIDAGPNEVVYLEYAYGRDLGGEALDKRFAAVGLIISGNHAIARIQPDEALEKLKGLNLSI